MFNLFFIDKCLFNKIKINLNFKFYFILFYNKY